MHMTMFISKNQRIDFSVPCGLRVLMGVGMYGRNCIINVGSIVIYPSKGYLVHRPVSSAEKACRIEYSCADEQDVFIMR
jgi:hypothetical protein